MKKKVLFVNRALSGGGSERVMSILANYFVNQGVQSQMLLWAKAEQVYPVSEKLEIVDVHIPIKGNKVIWYIKQLRAIRKAIRRSDADTVISFMWDTNIKVILASLGLHKRIIISERGNPNSTDRRRSFRFACKYIYPLAAVNVFQTEQVKSFFSEKIQEKSVVIPNPVVDSYHVYTGEREKRIVASGRFVTQKNFSMLIKAFKIVHEKYPEYMLEFYGDGPLKREMEQQIEEAGLSEAVVFKGYVANVAEQIQTAGIYASSSNFEGISNSMLEAMAMGIPSVCTDCQVGGARMVIDDRVNGILVPVNDYYAMAQGIIDIISNPDFAKKLSTEAQKVVDTYSLEHIGKRWIQLC